MRVNRGTLIVDLSERYGGADVRVLELARSLQGRYPYSVATLAGSVLHEKLSREKLNVSPIRLKKGDPRLLGTLVSTARALNLDVMDGHNAQSQFWGQCGAFLGGMKMVTTVHSCYREEHPHSFKGKAYEAVLRLSRARHNSFIAVSEPVADYLSELGVARHNISVIPNAVTTKASSPTSSNQLHALWRQYGWSREHFVVTSLGRLEPVKGHRFLVEAVASIATQFPQLRVLLVGEGKCRAELASLIRARNLDRVVMLAGFRDDVAEILVSSQAFCLPSLSEGLPFALLEACSAHLPILATNVGGMRTILRHQQNSFLVPPEDPQRLAEGLIWLMSDAQRAQRLGGSAAEIVKQFSPEAMANKTIDVYSHCG